MINGFSQLLQSSLSPKACHTPGIAMSKIVRVENLYKLGALGAHGKTQVDSDKTM